MSVGTAEDAAHLDRAAGPFRLSRLLSVFVAQRDRWALWSPVLFATGIALYFALTVEPGIETGAIASGVCLVALGFA